MDNTQIASLILAKLLMGNILYPTMSDHWVNVIYIFSDCGIDFTDNIFKSSEDKNMVSTHLPEQDDELDKSISVSKNHDDSSSNDDLSYDVNIDEECGSDDDELYKAPYFTLHPFPDDNIPFCENPFISIKSFSTLSIFSLQMELHELFNCNKGSLTVYNKMIDMFN